MLDVTIRKSLGDFKLHADFQAGNEILGVLGPSGSGKSITLRSIAGIETPNEGRIMVNDRLLFDSRQKINILPRQRNIGYVFQNYALFPHLTVKENIAFGLQGLNKRDKTDRVQETLHTFRLKDREDHYPSQLSGGQQQRVSLARTLITRPDLLLLDEPFSALDNHIKRHLENELLEIIRNNFTGTVLLVTHNIEEAHRLCDRILVYAHGRNVQIGDKHEVTERPATLEVAQVVGCRNLINVSSNFQDNTIKTLLSNSKTKVQINSKTTVGFHSYHLHLYDNDPQKLNTFYCQIVDVMDGTFYISITVNCDNHFIHIDMDKMKWNCLAKNIRDKIYLHIPPEKVFFIG